MIRPRFIAYILAILRGSFWLSCPMCRQYFAGFEWKNGAALYTYDPQGVAVCPKCAPEAERYNSRTYLRKHAA